MKVIVVGAGQVGSRLAQVLAEEGHDVVVIDQNEKLCQQIDDTYDAKALVGLGTDFQLLKEAEIESADMLIAATSSDETNIVVSFIGAQLGVPRRFARIRNKQYSDDHALVKATEFGITRIIHPELEAAEEIVRLIRYPRTLEVVEFGLGEIIIFSLKLDDNSPIVDETLVEVNQIYTQVVFRIIAIEREGKIFIPKGMDKLQPKDRIYVTTQKKYADEFIELAVGKTNRIRNVMILGGGTMASEVAQKLQKNNIDIKIVESNEQRSEMLADKLPDVMVINGDGTDIDLLAQEGITDSDCYIALTTDDETNIVSSLVARHLRVPHTITLLSKDQYLPIVRTIGLDVAINMNDVTVGAILKYIRKGPLVSCYNMQGHDANLMEFSISGDSALADKFVSQIEPPCEMILVSVGHKDKWSVPTGDTYLHAGDKVVIFAESAHNKKIEKLFQ